MTAAIRENVLAHQLPDRNMGRAQKRRSVLQSDHGGFEPHPLHQIRYSSEFH